MQSNNSSNNKEDGFDYEEEEEKKALLIAQKRDFYSRPDDKSEDEEGDEGDLFSPSMFLNESDKPIEFEFAVDESDKLRLSVWCVDRELQHTATGLHFDSITVVCWS